MPEHFEIHPNGKFLWSKSGVPSSYINIGGVRSSSMLQVGDKFGDRFLKEVGEKVGENIRAIVREDVKPKIKVDVREKLGGDFLARLRE